MRPKSRLLKFLLIGLVAFLVVGYFVFSTLLFSPLEKGFEARLAALVSREVDFYLAKADLGDLFGDFPRLAVADRLEQTTAWNTFERSAEYADLVRDLGLEEALAELDRSLEQVPFVLDPLEVFGGEEVAIAARIGESPGSPIDWALYGRVNWMGKLAVEALSYPGLLGLDAQGIAVEKGDGWVQLSGGTLSRPVAVARMRDVVIVASAPDFITTARDLEARGMELSILQSARYFDHIHNAPLRGADEDEFEFFLDVRKLMANQGMQGPWPDTRSQLFGPAFAGRLFQLPACEETVGLLDFEGGLALDLHAELASEVITPQQTRLYRERGFERADVLRDVASIVPEDAGVVIYLKGPIDTLLKMALESVEPALRTNLEDAFRSTGKYTGLDHLVSELGSSIHNRLLLVLRERDYRYRDDEEAPPNDGQPTFAIALVTWSQDAARIKALGDAIGQNGDTFGLQGARPGDGGYYSYKSEGFQTYEFWSPFVVGTGVITTMPANEHYLVSNEIKMLPHLVRTYLKSEDRYRRLSDLPQFQALLASALPDANALVWINPRRIAPTMRELARSWAERNAQLGVDWRERRIEEERRVLPQLFPGKRRDQLNQEEQAQLDAAVDDVLQNARARLREDAVPALMARKLREIEYLETIEAGLLMLKLDPRALDLSVRVLIPLEEGA